MCLAKAYVRSDPADSAQTGDSLVMENVTRLEVDGDRLVLTSLLGQREELQGRVSSVSFIDGRVVIEPWPR